MAVELATLDGVLKRKYSSDNIARIQQLVADFLGTIGQGSEKPGGENASVYGSIDLEIYQSGGAQNQNEQFRTDEYGTSKQSTIASKINIWPITLTNFAIELTKGNAEAFMPGLKKRFDDAAIMMKKDENRQCFGYGQGVLALVNGAIAASTALVVDTPGVQNFFPGMRIDVGTSLANLSAGVYEATNVKISSINYATNTLTLATAVTVSDNSFIVRKGVGTSAPSDGKEMMGLQGITDDSTLCTTFQGLSRTTYETWRGTVVDAAGAALTADLLQRAADKGERRSGQIIDTIVSNRVQRRQYLNLTLPLKRFMSDKLDAGFQVLEWNGIKWLVSHECQTDKVYMYPKKLLKKYESYPIKLDDSNGSTLTRIPGTDTIEAYYKHYCNIGTWYPNAFTVIKSLATLSE